MKERLKKEKEQSQEDGVKVKKNTFIFIFGLKNDPPKKGYDPSKKLAKKRRRRIE